MRITHVAATAVRELTTCSYIVTNPIKIQDEFKTDVGIKVSEVFKGGSLGQGTQVPFNYDIDLVLYSECKLCRSYVGMTAFLILMTLPPPSPISLSLSLSNNC